MHGSSLRTFHIVYIIHMMINVHIRNMRHDDNAVFLKFSGAEFLCTILAPNALFSAQSVRGSAIYYGKEEPQWQPGAGLRGATPSSCRLALPCGRKPFHCCIICHCCSCRSARNASHICWWCLVTYSSRLRTVCAALCVYVPYVRAGIGWAAVHPLILNLFETVCIHENGNQICLFCAVRWLGSGCHWSPRWLRIGYVFANLIWLNCGRLNCQLSFICSAQIWMQLPFDLVAGGHSVGRPGVHMSRIGLSFHLIWYNWHREYAN